MTLGWYQGHHVEMFLLLKRPCYIQETINGDQSPLDICIKELPLSATAEAYALLCSQALSLARDMWFMFMHQRRLGHSAA
jgi:hypothetical protein